MKHYDEARPRNAQWKYYLTLKSPFIYTVMNFVKTLFVFNILHPKLIGKDGP